MLSKAVGALSILYFIYSAYIAITLSGLIGIVGLLYTLPYLIAGILLLREEHKIITILCGIILLFIPFHLAGYNIAPIISNITSPIYLTFSIVLPVLIIYSAIKE